MMSTIQTSAVQYQDNGQDYIDFRAAQVAHFNASIEGQSHLFITDATGLFDAFLEGLPADARQHYTCRSCRRFVEQFGGLVSIGADGTTHPVLWPDVSDVPRLFKESVANVKKLLRKAQVSGVHVTDEKTWGTPSNTAIAGPHTGKTWYHMHAIPAKGLVRKPSVISTAFQDSRLKDEEYGMLRRGLVEFSPDNVRQALHLLTSGSLYRSEKCIGAAQWLSDLHGRIEGVKNTRQVDNMVWSAVASAPVGFAHVKTGMLGTLLEDVQGGLSIEAIKAKFDAKMNPLLYQRPQAAPSAGNLAQAEKVIASLAAAGSLWRRYAKLEDVQALWKPAEKKPSEAAESVFGHLKPKDAPKPAQALVPRSTMTWVKFQSEVLPSAASIEFAVPMHGNFCALITAVDPDAPPIIQWDSVEVRNQVSWYVYGGGSPCTNWGLRTGQKVRVNAIALKPSMWNGGNAHQGRGLVFVLEGAKEPRSCGVGLFPEILKSEFHGIRASIEAYSQSKQLEGVDKQTANGYMFSDGGSWNSELLVTDNAGQKRIINLDRWD